MSEITRSDDHRYTFRGVTYPGVTGILKIIDKSDALMAWAARQTAEAALAANIVHLSEQVGPEGAIKAVTSRSSWKRDEAASLGTMIHSWADAIAQGTGNIALVPVAAQQQVTHYAQWWELSGWTVRVSEALLVNTDLGYGGTLDLLARDRDGRTVLADVKTGRAIYNDTALQLCAYGNATWIEATSPRLVEAGKTTVLYRMPKVDRYVILHVTREGVREVEVPVGELEREAFSAAMKLTEWKDSVKGRRL